MIAIAFFAVTEVCFPSSFIAAESKNEYSCSTTTKRDCGANAACLESASIPIDNSTLDYAESDPSRTEACIWHTSASLKNAGAFTAIDIRNAASKNAAYLTNVLSLEPHTIAEKQFLRGQQLLLIGSQFDGPNLDRLCVQLLIAGHQKVAALRNGLLTWERAGFEVNYLNSTGLSADHVSAPELLDALAAKATKIWLLKAQSTAWIGVVAKHQTRVFETRADWLAAVFKNADSKASAPVILVDDETARQLLLEYGTSQVPENFFWYADGANALVNLTNAATAAQLAANTQPSKPCHWR